MVDTEDKLYDGETCYFTFIAPKNELQPLYERVKHIEGINCVFQQDKYRPEYWLELCPGNMWRIMYCWKCLREYLGG